MSLSTRSVTALSLAAKGQRQAASDASNAIDRPGPVAMATVGEAMAKRAWSQSSRRTQQTRVSSVRRESGHEVGLRTSFWATRLRQYKQGYLDGEINEEESARAVLSRFRRLGKSAVKMSVGPLPDS